jgi:hypothetical protein
MSKKKLTIGTLLLSAGLFASCGGGHVAVGYRAYDPYYSDYHTWNDGENVYYNRWVVESHHPHRDYRRLPRHDQRAYWQWRHSHR